MKLIYCFVVFALMALLEGCNPVEVKDVLNNLDKDCVRHYSGSLASGGVGGVGASGTVTFNIDCKPSGVPATPTPTPAQ